MPKYSYTCNDCKSEYEIWHGMTKEHTHCEVCEAPSVVRIPALLGEVKFNNFKNKAGDVVTRTIEESKQEVKEYKKNLNKELKK